MPREYFCAYHSYIEVMEQLNDAERGRLFTACLTYSKTGEAPQLSGNERFVFPCIRSQIDRDTQNYETYTSRQSENGKKGGRPRKASETQKTQPFSEEPEKAKEKEKEKEMEKKKTMEKESDIDSPERQAASRLPTVCLLPLNTGEEYPVTVDQVEEWAKLYPAVNIQQQLNAMRGWCLANPSRRKTSKGILRFINSWLSKEQDRGGKRAPPQSGDQSTNNPFLRMMMEDESHG